MISNINDDLGNLCKYLCDNSTVITAKISKYLIISNKNIGSTYDNSVNDA